MNNHEELGMLTERKRIADGLMAMRDTAYKLIDPQNDTNRSMNIGAVIALEKALELALQIELTDE